MLPINQENKNDSKLSNSPRNGQKIIRWEIAVFGGSGISTTLYSQFHFVHTYDSHHT